MRCFIKECLILALLAIGLSGCRVDVPDIQGSVVSIAYLKSLYEGRPRLVGREMVVHGVVVNSDREANFSREIVIQDATGAITVRADVANLYKLYPAGSSVAIICSDLTLGAYGGRIELGEASDDPRYQTGRIESLRLPTVMTILREPIELPEVSELSPAEFSPRDIGKFIKVSNLRIDVAMTWAGSRTFFTVEGDSVVVRTTESAHFAQMNIPQYAVDMCAILGWFNGVYQLHLNSVDDVVPSVAPGVGR